MIFSDARILKKILNFGISKKMLQSKLTKLGITKTETKS